MLSNESSQLHLFSWLVDFILGNQDSQRYQGMLASSYKFNVSLWSGSNQRVTYDILHEHKKENVVNIEVELCEDHTGDISRKEDQDQAEDAQQIFYLHFPVFLLDVCRPPDRVDDGDDEVGHTGHGGAAHGGEDDGHGDRADALVGLDVVAHRAGQVGLLAEELVSHEAVQEGDQPDGAQGHLLQDAQLAQVKIVLLLPGRGLGLHHGPLPLRHGEGQVDGVDLLVRALHCRAEHRAGHLQPPQPREDGEPGEDEDGPGQDGPGQTEAEAVEHAEGDVGLAGVGSHCVRVVDYGDGLDHHCAQEVGKTQVYQNLKQKQIFRLISIMNKETPFLKRVDILKESFNL